MTARNCLLTLVLVLFFGALPGAADSDRFGLVGPHFSRVSCTFEVARVKGNNPQSTFEVGGTLQNPHYYVKIDSHEGRARLVRNERLWPETFEMSITGWRDTIVSISLVPEGCGKMHLRFVPGKKWVTYYDERGKELDQPEGVTFRFEAVQTEYGVDVKVTLPQEARSIKRIDVNYWATAW
jgi:hypothetical protein